ncbi:hypothetical protein LVY72_17725 [Arthrobacter sp. I2-34]|uniref:Uncharacterized protein n=1 Tax=Arthrobacter hankyongi TaxID=2904801 RepID=A0ABS9LBA1_9MICC|nr:hypothetical protein [Arthrobacter hankyongi]MCG2623737.1 hypothetical protein [Arthrobacter hankyongi]
MVDIDRVPGLPAPAGLQDIRGLGPRGSLRPSLPASRGRTAAGPGEGRDYYVRARSFDANGAPAFVLGTGIAAKVFGTLHA